jgi:gliding motility-associated peptidyl-prolyl isomerase
MKQFFSVVLILLVLGCQGPEPRKPVKVNSGSTYKASIERSKALLKKEEKLIQNIMSSDTTKTYLQNAAGSWYYYNVKNEKELPAMEPNDVVTLTYNIVDFSNDTIYKMIDIGVLRYKVDKLDLFPGLRSAVPLLKENETATFLFPSSLAYGYHGDDQKIGVNVPLKSTLTILKIEKQLDILQN